MDVSQVTASSSYTSMVQGTGGGGHHHHHRKSISDQVNQMGTAIDNAVKVGTMTGDQATSLKNELSDITKTLSQTTQPSTSSTSATSTTGQTGQSNQLSQLSDADRKKVFSELQDVRKQLRAAGPQASNQVSGSSNSSDAAAQLFSQIDTDGNGSIDKSEFTQYLANLGAQTLGYDQSGNTSSAYLSSTFSAFA